MWKGGKVGMTDPETLANVFVAQTRALLYNLRPDVIADKKQDSSRLKITFM